MTRREWLAAGGLALLGGCGRKSGAGFPGYALIATSGASSISVIDLGDFRLLKEVPVGGAPESVRAVPETRHSFVMTPRTGSVHVLGSSFEHVNSRKFADELAGFQLTADGRHVLAITGRSRELVEAETVSLNVTRRWKLSADPIALDVAADGAVAISTGPHGAVEFVDRKTGRQTRKEFGAVLGDVRFRQDGKLLMVANYQEQVLTALDVPSLGVLVDLPLAMQPQNLCFKADGGELFISGNGMDGIAIASPYLPLDIDQTVLGGRDPGVMACSGTPAYLFVASASGSDVCILDINSRKMIGIVEVGQRPSFIAITPDDQYALVLNEGSEDMAVIRIATIQQRLGNAAVMRGKAAASLFTMLPVGSKPIEAAILPRGLI
jgi:hypothetical protein